MRRRPRRLALIGVPALLLSTMTGMGVAQEDDGLDPVEDPHDACPDDDNPTAPFTDRDETSPVHRLNLDCAYNNDIAQGYGDGTFRPRPSMTRAQFASFLVRTLEAADAELPTPSDQGFADIAGSDHEDAINILAEADIAQGRSATRFAPNGTVGRDQTASFVMRAASFLQDVPMSSIQRDDGPFEDLDPDNPHATNINGAAHFQITVGTSATTYQPDDDTSRQQMASFLIRILAALVEGDLIPPEEIVEEVEFPDDLAANPVGTDHAATVVATDVNGDPVRDAAIRFEVFRHDDPVVEPTALELELVGSATTDAAGEATFTYTGPDDPADDRIAACVVRGPVADAGDDEAVCGQIVDGDAGEELVPTDEVPADVAQKKWGNPAVAIDASAVGVVGSIFGEDLVEEPVSSISLSADDGDRADEDTAGGDLGLIEEVLDLGVVTTRAAGDLDFGLARAEASTADVDVLEIAGVGPVLGAEAVSAVANASCAGPYEDLDDATDSQFVELTVLGQEVPLTPEANTGFEDPLGLLSVVVNEVVPHDDDEDGHGYTVRGLRVIALDLPLVGGIDVTVGESDVSLECEEDIDTMSAAGLDAATIEAGDHIDWQTVDIHPDEILEVFEAHLGDGVDDDTREQLRADYEEATAQD